MRLLELHYLELWILWGVIYIVGYKHRLHRHPKGKIIETLSFYIGNWCTYIRFDGWFLFLDQISGFGVMTRRMHYVIFSAGMFRKMMAHIRLIRITIKLLIGFIFLMRYTCDKMIQLPYFCRLVCFTTKLKIHGTVYIHIIYLFGALSHLISKCNRVYN